MYVWIRTVLVQWKKKCAHHTAVCRTIDISWKICIIEIVFFFESIFTNDNQGMWYSWNPNWITVANSSTVPLHLEQNSSFHHGLCFPHYVGSGYFSRFPCWNLLSSTPPRSQYLYHTTLQLLAEGHLPFQGTFFPVRRVHPPLHWPWHFYLS